MATIKIPSSVPSPAEDSEQLRKAFADQNECVVIDILGRSHGLGSSDYVKLGDLKTDPKDEYLKLLRATIKCLTCPEKYYEKSLRLAINRLRTDEWALTRGVVTQADTNHGVDQRRIP